MTASAIPHTVLQPFDTRLAFLAPGLSAAVTKSSGRDPLHGAHGHCYSGWLQGRLPKSPSWRRCATARRSSRSTTGRSPSERGSGQQQLWRRRMLERGFPPEKVKLVHNPRCSA
jgi:hypothetical protein